MSKNMATSLLVPMVEVFRHCPTGFVRNHYYNLVLKLFFFFPSKYLHYFLLNSLIAFYFKKPILLLNYYDLFTQFIDYKICMVLLCIFTVLLTISLRKWLLNFILINDDHLHSK